MGFKEIIGYLLVGFRAIAAWSGFVFRSPMFIIIQGHLIELSLILLLAGLIAFSFGAVMIFRSVI